MLVGMVDPALYETNNAEQAALRVRDVARAVQQQLGDEYPIRTLQKQLRWMELHKHSWPFKP